MLPHDDVPEQLLCCNPEASQSLWAGSACVLPCDAVWQWLKVRDAVVCNVAKHMSALVHMVAIIKTKPRDTAIALPAAKG